MKILTGYFSREYVKTFALCMAAFVVLYLTVDLFERIDDMIEHQVPFTLMVKYGLCTIPMIVYQGCPLAVLLCTFITIGLFVRHQEIVALKAHGISLFEVLRVLLVITGALCLFSFWLQEYVLPYSNWIAKEIKTVHIKGKTQGRFFTRNHFWYRDNNTIYNIDFYDIKKRTLENIAILDLNDAFGIVKRIDAKSARWIDGKWVFRQGTIRNFFDGGGMRVSTFSKKVLDIHKTPEDFDMSRKEGDEMGIREIIEYIQTIRKAGYSSTGYEVELHGKFSYPLINLIMAVLGIPFALRIGRSGSMALGIALSVLIGFFYWVFYAFCLSLGTGGLLPPFLAAWVANIAFGCLGLYMFLHVRQ